MTWLRAVAATAVAGAFSVVAVVPVGADASGGAITDGDAIDYGAIVGGHGPGRATSGTAGNGSGGPVCTYRLLGGPENFPVYDLDGHLIEVTDGGAWYEKTCDGVFYGAVYLDGSPDAVNPAAIAAGVLKRMTIPAPQISFSPATDQVVGLPSWVWIQNWAPLVGSASVAGVTVTVTARPSSARWSFGDGTTSTCAAGVAWSPAADRSRACTHTWKRSSASRPGERMPVTATVTWQASYSVTGGAGGGTLDTLTRSTTVTVRVAEVQALNERDGG